MLYTRLDACIAFVKHNLYSKLVFSFGGLYVGDRGKPKNSDGQCEVDRTSTRRFQDRLRTARRLNVFADTWELLEKLENAREQSGKYAGSAYEYEYFAESEPNDPIQIHGWIPVATDRFTRPIEELLAEGKIRRIATESQGENP